MKTIKAEETWMQRLHDVSSATFLNRISILSFLQNYAIEVASDEVPENYATIDSKHLPCMRLQKGDRSAQVVEGIGDAVSEATYDEQRHSKKQRKIIILSGKLY